jgi:MarR family transcriptional regulator for hemolysin
MTADYDRFGDALSGVLKAWRCELDARLRPFGLSQARWQVLLKLLRATEPLAQCELALRIGIEPASLVRLLDVLQQEDLVLRTPDPLDRRSKLVSLTERGQSLSAKLSVAAEALRTEVLGSIELPELARCTTVLELMQQRIEHLGRPD